METVKNLECFSLSEKNYVTSFFFFCLPGNQEPPPAQVLIVATMALLHP